MTSEGLNDAPVRTGTPFPEFRAFAEEPGARGDHAESLRRWRAALGDGVYPQAAAFVAKHLIRLGREREAATVLETADPIRRGDRRALRPAVIMLRFAERADCWLELAARLLQEEARDPENRDDALVRRVVESFLERHLRLARESDALGRFFAEASKAEGLPTPLLCRLYVASLLLPTSEAVRIRLADALPPDGSLPPDLIADLGQEFAGDRAIFERVRDRIRPDLRLLAEQRPSDMRPSRAVPHRDASDRTAHAIMERIAESGALEPALAREHEELARRAGDLALALIRQGVTLADRASPRPAELGRMARVLERVGASVEVVRLLARTHPASEPLALAWARALAPISADPVAVWRRVESLFPTIAVRLRLADALLHSLRYDEGLGLLDALMSEAEADERSVVWRRLLDAARTLGRFRDWQEATESPPPGIDPGVVRRERLRYLLESGRREAGRALLDEALADEPKPEEARVLRRIAARFTPIDGTPEEALAHWEAIGGAGDGRDDCHSFLLALFAAGRLDTALLQAERYAERFPGDPRFPLKCAQGYERLRLYDKALLAYRRVQARALRSGEAAAGIARALLYLDRYEELGDHLDIHASLAAELGVSRGWVHAARALAAARRGADDDRVADAYRPAYAEAAQEFDAWSAALAAMPAATRLGGAFAPHPAATAAAHNGAFVRLVRDIRDARAVTVVGNGPSILGSGKGPAIDASDFVIRLNDFQLGGYEADVGSRVDLWYSTANRLARPDWDSVLAQDSRILLNAPSEFHYPDIATFAAWRFGRELDARRLSYVPVHILAWTNTAVYPKPTTGLRFIMMLELLAQRPYAIAGFDFFENDGLHYFDRTPGRLQIGEVHAVDFERDFVTHVLARVGRLTIL